MKKVFKWMKRILIAIIGLITVLMIGLYITFFFWKKAAIQNLPQNSEVITTSEGPVEYSLKGNSDRYMLMIHGSPGSVHVAGGESFLNKGFSVLAVSRPGYYKTPLSSGGTPTDEAALYKSLLDELKIDSVFVNGISGGGPPSIQFAIDYPDRCAGLILSAAVSEKMEDTTDDNGLLSSFFQTEFGTWLGIQIAKTQMSKQESEIMDRFVERGVFPFVSIDDGLANDNNVVLHLKDFEMERIMSPTILFHGDKDENVPYTHSQNAAKRIPNSTLFEMKGKDHYVFFTSYSDTINTEIMQFIDNIETHEK
ncbi:alpha/beta fold hydrolase [Allomuricauda sp. F6463D]|uniref:alpha/beta fold hydrolase n=1 Tax=Allomuricauda sp. F6463D TaxID=2926409 RepID=UPI001FF1C6C0|nr:alpha/beta hydrolase [Muricauda sp. F6463D]MCK0159649.1 alpha/beta hydrolase [Muricauda sp. F6463D]